MMVTCAREGCENGWPERTGSGRRRLWCSERCRKLAKYAGTCVDCGAPTSNNTAHPPERCRLCAPKVRERPEAAERKKAAILAMWRGGATLRLIAETFETTPESVQVRMAQWRAEGIDVPYRYPGNAARAAAR